MTFDEAVEAALLEHEQHNTINWKNLEEKSGINKDRIRSKVRRILGTHDGKQSKKYEIDNECYSWTLFDGTPVKMTIKELDELFYAYSEKGLNLSSYEIRMKYDIPAKIWNSIKHRFELYKSSNVFSPETVKQAKKNNVLENIVEQQIDKANSHTQLLVEKTWENRLRENYKKIVKEQYNKDYIADKVTESLVPFLDDIKSEILKKETIKFSGAKNSEATIVLTDLHIGVEYKNKRVGIEYNDDIILSRLLQIAAEINVTKVEKINVVFLGDFIETFSGLNHKNSWQGIAKEGWGAEVVFKTFTLLKKFIMSLNGDVSVYAIGGNHDRAASDKSAESESQISKIIFGFLKEALPSNIKLQYDSTLTTFSSNGITYILTHGDKSLSKKNPDKLVLDYGNNKEFNVLLSGHYHSPQILGYSAKYVSLLCPSFLSMNKYAEEIGAVNRGGWTLIEPNQNKSVNFKFNIF